MGSHTVRRYDAPMAKPMDTPAHPVPEPDAGHPAVASPCVRMCTLDDDDVCVGCGRTLDDITGWTSMSDPDKAACVARARERLIALGRPLPPVMRRCT